MWKMIGCALVIGGVGGVLHSWIQGQKERQMRLDVLLHFLRKSIGAMENEKMKVSDYFAKYILYELQSEVNQSHSILEKTLTEIMQRLSTNTYPNGQSVWEEVFEEEEQNWAFDREVFQMILQAGNGFFGKSRMENISFLKKSLRELEEQKGKEVERDAKERKVWVPVGLLGAVMMVILFI